MTGFFGILRHSTVLFLLLAGALSLVLFSVKYRVQGLEQELVNLNRAIISDREAIHILNAEWAHLNNPARLEQVVDKFFDLAPVHANQMGTFDSLPPMPASGKGDAQ